MSKVAKFDAYMKKKAKKNYVLRRLHGANESFTIRAEKPSGSFTIHSQMFQKMIQNPILCPVAQLIETSGTTLSRWSTILQLESLIYVLISCTVTLSFRAYYFREK